MKVSIINAATQVTVVVYTIYLDGPKKNPKPADFIDETWRCAVEDGLVKEENREKYQFRLRL